MKKETIKIILKTETINKSKGDNKSTKRRQYSLSYIFFNMFQETNIKGDNIMSQKNRRQKKKTIMEKKETINLKTGDNKITSPIKMSLLAIKMSPETFLLSPF